MLSLSISWSIDTDPLVMLRAKTWMVKIKYLTQQLHQNGVEVTEERSEIKTKI